MADFLKISFSNKKSFELDIHAWRLNLSVTMKFWWHERSEIFFFQQAHNDEANFLSCKNVFLVVAALLLDRSDGGGGLVVSKRALL